MIEFNYALTYLLFFRRLRFNIFLPLFVAIRLKKPCLRFLRISEGWNVRFKNQMAPLIKSFKAIVTPFIGFIIFKGDEMSENDGKGNGEDKDGNDSNLCDT